MIKGAYIDPSNTYQYAGKNFTLAETVTVETCANQLVTIKTFGYNNRFVVFANGYAVNFKFGLSSIGVHILNTYTWPETRIIITHIVKSQQTW